MVGEVAAEVAAEGADVGADAGVVVKAAASSNAKAAVYTRL